MASREVSARIISTRDVVETKNQLKMRRTYLIEFRFDLPFNYFQKRNDFHIA